MTGEPTGADPGAAALPRLYFLGLLESHERGPVLDRLTERFEKGLARLTELEDRIDAQDVPEEYRDVYAHQRATLDYGIATHRFAIDWFRAHTEQHQHSDGDPERT